MNVVRGCPYCPMCAFLRTGTLSRNSIACCSLECGALLPVRITGEKTYEDRQMTSPEERTRHSCRWERLRLRGTDCVDRMTSVGFVAQVLRAVDVVSSDECTRMSFNPGTPLFDCRTRSPDDPLETTSPRDAGHGKRHVLEVTAANMAPHEQRPVTRRLGRRAFMQLPSAPLRSELARRRSTRTP